MQVFIIGSVLETAMILDKRRLNKQIIECRQIIDALKGASAWSNHPCVLQYRGYEFWLRCYKRVLEAFVQNDDTRIHFWNFRAYQSTPNWHNHDYYEQMKRRLYTKDKKHYSQFAEYGESECNWYWSQEEDKFIKYIKGKRV